MLGLADPLYLLWKGFLPLTLLGNDGCEAPWSLVSKFVKRWFVISREEARLLWKARNKHHHEEAPTRINWVVLRAQFREALIALRAMGRKLPHPDVLKSANRFFMESYVEKADLAYTEGSIAAFLADEGGHPLSVAEAQNVIQKDKAIRAEVLSQQRAIRKAKRSSLSQLRLDSYFRVPVGSDSAAVSRASARALSRYQRHTHIERRAVSDSSDSEEDCWDDSDELYCSSEDEQFSY